MYFELGSNNNELLEFVWAKYEDNGAIGIGPFSCRFQRLVGPNGQLLHPPHGQSNRIPGRPENNDLSGLHSCLTKFAGRIGFARRIGGLQKNLIANFAIIIAFVAVFVAVFIRVSWHRSLRQSPNFLRQSIFGGTLV